MFLALTLAAVAPRQAPLYSWHVYRGGESWSVAETTVRDRDEATRSGSVKIKLVARTRDGWNDLTATTEWSDSVRNRETVRLLQNPKTGELQCVWIKGTLGAWSFDPPLVMWPGRGRLPESVHIGPTLRPFGRGVASAGKSLPYVAPDLVPGPDTVIGLCEWEAGDATFPRKMRLEGEIAWKTEDDREPGLSGRSFRAVYFGEMTERTFETTKQGEKLVQVKTTVPSLRPRGDGY